MKLWILLAALALAGCGGSSDGKVSDPDAGQEHGASRLQRYDKILKGEFAEECDQQNANEKRRMLSILDSRAAQIARWDSTQNSSKIYETVQYGPAIFRKWVGSQERKTGWQNATSSWAELLELMTEFNAKPDLGLLSYINRQTLYILSDDESRVLDEANYYLDKNSGPYLERLYLAAEECSSNSNCLRPALDSDLITFVRGNFDFDHYYWQPLNTDLSDDRRIKLKQNFVNAISGALKRYQFRREKSVERSSYHKLTLPLNPGNLTDISSILKKLIEDKWKGQKISLNIRWDTSPDAYKFEYGQASGDRAWVNRETRTIHLYPGTRLSTIPHEIGHVLGFRDRYYTVWNRTNCTYTEQYNEEDLMSESTLGDVQESDWEKLDQEYPYTTVQPR